MVSNSISTVTLPLFNFRQYNTSHQLVYNRNERHLLGQISAETWCHAVTWLPVEPSATLWVKGELGRKNFKTGTGGKTLFRAACSHRSAYSPVPILSPYTRELQIISSLPEDGDSGFVWNNHLPSHTGSHPRQTQFKYSLLSELNLAYLLNLDQFRFRHNYLQIKQIFQAYSKKNKQANSVAFSPQANYTDWATTTGWRILVPTFTDRGVSCSQHSGTPMAINLGVLDWSRYFLFHVALHLSSQGLSGLRSRPTATQNIW
jgi:hypothetical protein